MKDECLLLKGARELANKKELDASKVICSAINLCTGEFCIYLSPTGDTGPQQLEDFYTRLEKHQEMVDKQKLQQCRQRLEEEIKGVS